jgi:hypothetical protein
VPRLRTPGALSPCLLLRPPFVVLSHMDNVWIYSNIRYIALIRTDICFLTGHPTGLNLMHGAEFFFRSQQLLSCSVYSPPVMEPEGSLPCSQQPANSTSLYNISSRAHFLRDEFQSSCYRITHCQLSAVANPIYSQLPSISVGRDL